MALLETVEKCIQFVDKYSFDIEQDVNTNDVNESDDDDSNLTKFIIDGNNFTDIETFYDECQRVFNIAHSDWGRGLNAFNDIIRGGFGDIKDDNFILIWKNSNISKQRLTRTIPINDIDTTIFDILIDIITCKGSGHDNIQLRLQ